MQIHCIDKQKADQLESDVFVSHAILLAMAFFARVISLMKLHLITSSEQKNIF